MRLLGRAVAVVAAAAVLPSCTTVVEREGETLTTICAIFCITHKREGKIAVKQEAKVGQKENQQP